MNITKSLWALGLCLPLILGAQQAQQQLPKDDEALIEEITQDENVVLFNQLLEKVIADKGLQKRLRSKETLLFDKGRKRYVLKLIQQEKIIPFQEILANRIDDAVVARILAIKTGEIMQESPSGAVNIEDQNLGQELANEAILMLKKFGKDVEKIRDNLQNLKEANETMNTLIVRQGDRIQQVEKVVSQDRELVQKGSKNIEKAAKLQLNTRFYMLIVLLVVLLILLLLFAIRRRKKPKKHTKKRGPEAPLP